MNKKKKGGTGKSTATRGKSAGRGGRIVEVAPDRPAGRGGRIVEVAPILHGALDLGAFSPEELMARVRLGEQALMVWQGERLGLLLPTRNWPRCAGALKKRYPEIPIAFGGATFEDDIAEEILRNCPAIDYVHCGDADESLPEMVRRIYVPIEAPSQPRR